MGNGVVKSDGPLQSYDVLRLRPEALVCMYRYVSGVWYSTY